MRSDSNDWVGFQVVQTVYRDDPSFNLTEQQSPIGLEIKGPESSPGVRYHQAPWPAHLHIYGAYGDEYHPAIYGHDPTQVRSADPVARERQFEKGQVFAVNLCKFETWWFNQYRQPQWPDGLAVYWPSTVTRHNNHWPTSPAIVDIASQCGTGALNQNLHRWDIYRQNNSTLPGFNPNDEHAFRWPVENGEGAFALRNDLGSAATSEPYLIIPYQIDDPLDSDWNMLVYRVTAGNFNYLGKAGTRIQPPNPLNAFTDVTKSYPVSGPVWRDRKNELWAPSAGNAGTDATAAVTMRFFYADRPDQDFFYPPGYPVPVAGAPVPWLDRLAKSRNAAHPTGEPIDINYTIRWPDGAVPAGLQAACDSSTVQLEVVPQLLIGETLFQPKRGLPAIDGQKSVDILYQQSVANGGGAKKAVELIDPTRKYYVNGVPDLPPDVKKIPYQGKVFFEKLPPHLQQRLWHEPLNNRLVFEGRFIDSIAGEDYLQLNVISDRDKVEMRSISTNGAFRAKLDQLFTMAATPIVLNSSAGTEVDSFALTAGNAKGTGYVTLAFGASATRNLPNDPVALSIIKVAPPLYTGELKLVYPPSPFDEAITLRHSCDFLGQPEDFEFEYRFRPDPLPTALANNLNNWPTNYSASDWTGYPTAPGESSIGRSEIIIRGANINTLSDNWFICRYKPKHASHPLVNQWSDWTRPQLAEGWIKRVLAGINPFNQRYGSRPANGVNTLVSLIAQAGKQWEGQIPFVTTPEDIDKYGLIEIYESVLNRGLDLSVNGTPPINYAPANNALMLVAGRISNLYMLLGNEAYADAIDPTIAFGTSDGQFGAQASSLFCFKNQFPDLLGEELGLLRGRDDTLLPGTRVPPVYNRLFWNMTRDITGGEVAYVLNYGIRDNWTTPGNRVIAGDAAYNTLVDDAAKAFPQGHGDAWGHYLSALMAYQRLMANPNFTWVPTAEAVIVAGQPVTVDYYDERHFASAGAAKAKTGAEIVNLTYRERYTENPAQQATRFTDTRADRAWGVNDWAMRAGQGAYLDWVIGNAIIPDVDPDSSHTGVKKVDRSTVPELANIPSAYNEIQSQVDAADSGLNPVGVAQNAIPFDISPSELSGPNAKSHFEQIYARAVEAMNNAIRVFNFAYNSAQKLRAQADDVAKFQQTVDEREADFKNRLIEVFGYPYPNDIGNGKTYPDDYDGPDFFHYMYFDPSELLGRKAGGEKELTINFLTDDLKRFVGGTLPPVQATKFNYSTEGFGFIKPKSWTLPRRAQGELQLAHAEIMQAWGRYKRAAKEYDNVIEQIGDQNMIIGAQLRLMYAERSAGQAEVRILQTAAQKQQTLNELIAEARGKQVSYQNKAAYATIIGNALADWVPEAYDYIAVNGSAPLRGMARTLGAAVGQAFSEKAQGQAEIELQQQQAKEAVQSEANIDVVIARNGVIDDRAYAAIAGPRAQIQQLNRTKAILELDIFGMDAAMEQASNRYLQALARGLRLMDDRTRFLANTAADVQQYRYKDMAFRIFRDDALQKYRAQFDLAARYVYLTAKAYDYETGLLDTDSRSAQAFLTQIVRSRSLGTIEGGQPLTGGSSGDAGLADPMARMAQSWVVLKPRLGFNNPATSSFDFSLRHELLRIAPGVQNNGVWRDVLQASRVDNMLEHEEFRRFCIPPQGSGNVAEPAIILPFETSINNTKNFFGWPLGGGDHAYPSTHFAVKIKAAGVCFVNYNASIVTGLSATPYVYLVPAGLDTQRVPTDQFSIRSWEVIDQIIPTPFVLGQGDLNNPDYIPQADSLGLGLAGFGRMRQFPQMLGCHDGAGGAFNAGAPGVLNSRLVGRSVWNSRWLLIIPGSTFGGSDPRAALEQFINGRLVGGVRDGNGITDIRIHFDAYSYSGN